MLAVKQLTNSTCAALVNITRKSNFFVRDYVLVRDNITFEVPSKFEIFPMRICRDVEFVESLGSGIPRILRAYGEDCFKFTDNFIRITLPISVQNGT